MAEIYKLIHSAKYFNDYVSRGTRPDGRKFDEHRNIRLNIGSLKTADSSCVIKCGNTTVVCGINLELATPKAEEPEFGYLVTNVEVPPLCSSKFRPGPPSDYAQVTSKLVSDIITNSKCVDLKDLCIAKDKLAWVVHCDMVCLNNDGSLVDSCLISLMAALKTLNLPTVTYDTETEEISVDTSFKTPLKIHGLPVATSFVVYEVDQSNVILTDPTMYEEDVSGGLSANLIVCWNNEQLCCTNKFGGSYLSEKCQEQSLKIAKKRAKIIAEVIDTCINHTNI